MHATETITDPTALDDLEFAPPCGRHIFKFIDGDYEWKPACDHPAAWLGIFNCCGHDFLLCEQHKEQHGERYWVCLGCESRAAKVIDWRRI
jgi:hypothetical protein